VGFALGERKRQGVDDLESERYSIKLYPFTLYTSHALRSRKLRSNTHIVRVLLNWS